MELVGSERRKKLSESEIIKRKRKREKITDC